MSLISPISLIYLLTVIARASAQLSTSELQQNLTSSTGVPLYVVLIVVAFLILLTFIISLLLFYFTLKRKLVSKYDNVYNQLLRSQNLYYQNSPLDIEKNNSSYFNRSNSSCSENQKEEVSEKLSSITSSGNPVNNDNNYKNKESNKLKSSPAREFVKKYKPEINPFSDFSEEFENSVAIIKTMERYKLKENYQEMLDIIFYFHKNFVSKDFLKLSEEGKHDYLRSILQFKSIERGFVSIPRQEDFHGNNKIFFQDSHLILKVEGKLFHPTQLKATEFVKNYRPKVGDFGDTSPDFEKAVAILKNLPRYKLKENRQELLDVIFYFHVNFVSRDFLLLSEPSRLNYLKSILNFKTLEKSFVDSFDDDTIIRTLQRINSLKGNRMSKDYNSNGEDKSVNSDETNSDSSQLIPVRRPLKNMEAAEVNLSPVEESSTIESSNTRGTSHDLIENEETILVSSDGGSVDDKNSKIEESTAHNMEITQSVINKLPAQSEYQERKSIELVYVPLNLNADFSSEFEKVVNYLKSLSRYQKNLSENRRELLDLIFYFHTNFVSSEFLHLNGINDIKNLMLTLHIKKNLDNGKFGYLKSILDFKKIEKVLLKKDVVDKNLFNDDIVDRILLCIAGNKSNRGDFAKKTTNEYNLEKYLDCSEDSKVAINFIKALPRYKLLENNEEFLQLKFYFKKNFISKEFNSLLNKNLKLEYLKQFLNFKTAEKKYISLERNHTINQNINKLSLLDEEVESCISNISTNFDDETSEGNNNSVIVNGEFVKKKGFNDSHVSNSIHNHGVIFDKEETELETVHHQSGPFSEGQRFTENIPHLKKKNIVPPQHQKKKQNLAVLNKNENNSTEELTSTSHIASNNQVASLEKEPLALELDNSEQFFEAMKYIKPLVNDRTEYKKIYYYFQKDFTSKHFLTLNNGEKLDYLNRLTF
ncbi:hypothetical protein HDU92_001125 [Lobulomyces angularis]|nr:hypothetical protein HDU92_001125 [Lobulomyces angularis]